MKKATKFSNYLLISAESSFDGDPCDFAIVKLTQSTLSFIEKAFTRAALFENVENFDCHSYYFPIEGFHRTGINCSEEDLNQILNDGHSWAFIDIEQWELDNLEIPECSLDDYKMEITPQGSIRFTAIGEGTETHFKTTYVSILDLIIRYAMDKDEEFNSRNMSAETDTSTSQAEK
ncbi:hypothetical protein HGH93_21710 [Chitinophaga polysaccharea]|uniref:hypothetical protein n=1 Tax=Chitinophaga polysaccharea TaxID=1293035 RepID=UPI001454E796|nr:hypothetical protein [Chitinophaga polysaccharea]NLR60742.1 hypothetical protein [Chitinophaga polysaccharea]